MKNNKSNSHKLTKIKKGWRTYRKYEDKASIPVFCLFLLTVFVIVLFLALPDSPDRLFFIGFVVLLFTVSGVALSQWVKKTNKDKRDKTR